MPLTRTICAHVEVSWDGSGAFTGPYDDVTADTLGTPGIAIEQGRDGARALAPPRVSAADFVLQNHTGRYSQENAGSPVYQLIIPGRPVRVTADHGATSPYDEPLPYDETDYYDGGGTFVLARSIIDDISQDATLGAQTVELKTVGIETLMTAAGVTIPLMTAPRVDQCITAILDAVGWPADRRAISAASTTLLYWWCDDREPWPALLELLASEGPGSLYVDADGTFHFEDRNYRTTATRSVESQAAYFDVRESGGSPYDEHLPYDEPEYYDGAIAGLWFTTLSYDPGYRSIYNRATYTTRLRALAPSPSVVWSYGAPFSPPGGVGMTLIIRTSEPFANAIVPVLGTDFTVSGGTVSMGLFATSGFVAWLTVTAISGTPTVSGLQLRAQLLAVVSETTAQNAVDASSSIERFSPIPGADIPRVMRVDGWPEISVSAAMAVCDAWVTRYMVPRPAVTIELRNADAAHMSEIIQRRVSDRITVVERNTGLNADCWINGRELVIAGPGGTDVRAVLSCEKVDEVGGSRWDVGLWDTAIWGI